MPSSHESISNADLIAVADAHARAGRLGQSLALLDERLASSSNDRDLLYARALTLSDWGRHREALDGLRAAQARGLATFGLYLNLAQLSHILGFGEDAERFAREAMALDETHPDPHLCLAAILQSARRPDEAIRSYERAHDLAPSRFDCLVHIAACKVDQRDLAGAEQMARRAIEADGGKQARSWALLALALARQDRYDEALAAFDMAEEIDSDAAWQSEPFVMHGYNLLACGRVDDAIGLYRSHLPSQPHPSAHAHYGFSLLTAGRYLEGWQQYEFRWLDAKLATTRPALNKPRWNGQSLQGRTVLMWAEQGYGDTIQFARFAPVLKERGASVIFRVPAKLRELACGFVGVDRVVSTFDEITDAFDYQLAAMSAPLALATTVSSIPHAVPYLRIDEARVAGWREKRAPGKAMNIGLVWAGNPSHENDRHRSIPASVLSPLWDTSDVQFFSLQKERRAEDSASLPDAPRLIDLSDALGDFSDTAAAIKALDLLITVDTAVAHIAGALGKPCWLLLPANADFRWLRDREDSPWYPTIRLFRQKCLGEWGEVIGRVSGSLREAVRSQDKGEDRPALMPRVPEFPMSHEDDPHKPSPLQLSRVADTRYGLLQYSGHQEALARSVEWYGEWLQPQLDLLAKLLRPGATVIEAGSGSGAHSLALANMIGPTGHLFVYEADPLLSRILEQNLHINKSRNQVTVVRRDLAGLAPSIEPPPGHATDVPELDTVDLLCLPKLDLIKINDSAAASTILAGAAETLWRLRPVLLFAASDVAAQIQAASSVKNFGYRCWRMRTTLFNLNNFNRRESDIFAGAKALATLAIPEEIEVGVALDGCVEVE